jgi:hypothetical protein
MAIVFTEAAGQVRLLISDINEAHLVLSDEAIAGYLAGYGLLANDPVTPRSPILRAAADALDAIATSEALVSKVMQTVDGLQTDGAKVANSLRTRADSLRRQADALDDVDLEGPPDAYFGVVPFVEIPTQREAAEVERFW